MVLARLAMVESARNPADAPDSVRSGQVVLCEAPSTIAGTAWKMSDAREVFFVIPFAKSSGELGAPGFSRKAMVSLAADGELPSMRPSRVVWSAAALTFQPAALTQVWVPPLQPE